MLSKAIVELNAENRRMDKRELSLASIAPKVTHKIYTKLVAWIVESSGSLQISWTSVYLSRVYFDKVLSFYDILPIEDPVLLGVICISLAINFNEPRKVSERYCLQWLLQASRRVISPDQLCSLMDAVLTALDYNFRYTSPYDYFPIFFNSFPWYPQLEEALKMVLNLAIVLPESCENTAEQIFYGSLVAIFTYKQINLNQFQMQILSSLTDCWQKANTLSDKILFQLAEPAPEPESQTQS